eukprot:m.72890 g.72890  ORF g.72890 m.72890 type:complete len:55 (-) comp50258_c0_seq3:658-822(-)
MAAALETAPKCSSGIRIAQQEAAIATAIAEQLVALPIVAISPGCSMSSRCSLFL